MSATVTEPGNDELTYSWDFGDGNIAEGQNVNHIFDYGGDYTVTLTVNDDDGGIVSQTLPIYVQPSPKDNLQFLQHKLKLSVLENGVLVEQEQGKHNQPIDDNFDRISIATLDSPDIPQVLADQTFLDKQQGIGITDGEDGNSSSRKRIDGDETLVLSIKPTANYNSATTAIVNLDKIQSLPANNNEGQIKVVAVLGNEIVGEQLFSLNKGKGQFTYNNSTPFNSLYVMAADTETLFTFRSVEFVTTQFRIPITNNLRLEQEQFNLKVIENSVLVEQKEIDGVLAETFSRFDIKQNMATEMDK